MLKEDMIDVIALTIFTSYKKGCVKWTKQGVNVKTPEEIGDISNNKLI